MAVILVVEDEALLRMLAEGMIQGLGHQTLSAGDVDEALSLVRSPQHLDALFTDIRLKSAPLGGFELAHAAITLRPRLRVLYATGNSLTDKARALFVEGAHFLPKPYMDHQLQYSIEAMLAARL